MKNKVFWIIFIFAIIIRLFALNISFNDYVDWDEINSVKWNLENTNTIDLIKWISVNDPHPPLFHVIMRFFMNISGKNDFTYKYVIFIFSVLNCLLSYYIVIRMGFDRSRSLIFMLLFSISTYEIFDINRVYNSFLFFSMLNILLFYDFLNGKRKVFYIFSSVLLFYYHYFAIFIILPQIIIVFYRYREKLYNSMISMVFFLPYLVFAETSPVYLIFGKGSYNNISWINPYGMGFFREIFHKYTGEIFYFDQRFIFFEYIFLMILCVISLRVVFLQIKKNNIIVILYFISGILFFVTGFIYQVIFNSGIIEWNHVSYLFPFFLYCIIGICRRKWNYALIIVLFILSLFYGFRDYEYSELKIVREYINEIQPENVYFFPYYYVNNVPYYFKDCKARIHFLKQTDGFIPQNNSIILIRRLGENSNENKNTLEFEKYITENFNFKTIIVPDKFLLALPLL